MLASTPKFSAQAIRKIFDIGWKPLELVSNVSSSISAVIKPAGFDKATGVITGLVAGKPIWSADGKIEAGLKAFFGVLLGLGGMFALRTWGNVHVDLSALQAGSNLIGSLPAASLPIIAAVLAGFYEIDNSPSDAKKDESAAGGAAAQKQLAGKKVRVEAEDEAEDDEELEEPAGSSSTKKKGR